MRSKSWWLVLVSAAVLLPPAAFAAESKPSPKQETRPPFWQAPSYPEIPEFMQNWEFGINLDEGEKPRYFMDLILPIYRPDAEDRALFVEPVLHHLNSETLFNLGLAYRQFVADRRWMLGGNFFYDIESLTSHTRVGAGLEAVSSYAELRANSYFGLSKARVVQKSDSVENIEKAVDGFDLELGVPVPYYSRLKLFGGVEWYNFEEFKNREGWSVRAEYRPTPAVVLDLTLKDTNKRSTGWGMTIAFRPPFWENAPKKTRSPLKRDAVMFPDSDISDRLYIPVERQHEIVTEAYSKSSGQINVEIKRAN